MAKKKKFDAEAWADEKKEESVEIRRYQKKINDLERKLHSYRVNQGIIVDAVKEVLAKGLDLELPKKPKKDRRKKSEEVVVIHVSDTQVGKVTESYNTMVADERLQVLADKTIRATEARRNSAKIEECAVFLGGDLVEGEEVFKGQNWEIDSSVFAQSLRSVPEMLGRMLLTLAGSFQTVRVYGVLGNHGRNGPFGSRAHPQTNWDLVTMEVLEQSLKKEKRIKFNISQDWYQVINILGWSNLMVHGHQVRGGFAGFPWYGIGRRAAGWKSAIREWESDGDRWNRYLWLGHFHTPAMCTINDVIMLANGTTESDNEFARSELAASGRPCQRVAFFGSKMGILADLMVYLD